MYANRDRLATALHSLTIRFGPDVLSQPQRCRNLLFDEYGGDRREDRSDIDKFVEALSLEKDNLIDRSEPEGAISTRLSSRTGLAPGDAAWTVSIVREIAGQDKAQGQHLPPPQPLPVGRTDYGGPAVDSGWPTSAKRTVFALAAVIAILIGVAAALILSSRSETEAALEQVANLEESLATANSDTATDSTDQTGTTSTVGSTVAASVEATGESADSSSAELEALVAQLQTDNAALQLTLTEQQLMFAAQQVTIDDLNGQLAAAALAATQKQSEFDTTQAQLIAAQASATQLAEEYSIEPLKVRPPATNFRVTGTQVSCDLDTGCAATGTLGGRFLDEGVQLFFEVPEVAKIPLSTFDGFSYSGEATVTAAASFTCNEEPVSTLLRITASPVQIRANPLTKTFTYTAWNVTWIQSIDACQGASRTYTGTLTFS